MKNAQEEDNAATSAVIDVGEIDSDDEVLVATEVKEEEDSNIWVSSNGRSVELGGAASSGSGGSRRKAENGMDLFGPGVGESALSVTR